MLRIELSHSDGSNIEDLETPVPAHIILAYLSPQYRFIVTGHWRTLDSSTHVYDGDEAVLRALGYKSFPADSVVATLLGGPINI